MKFKPRLSVYRHLPTPVFMKTKQLPAGSEVVEHRHDWDQLIFAKTGVLEVSSDSGDYIIPSEQAVWIPANRRHSIATTGGAELRSVHLDKGLLAKSAGQTDLFNDIRVLKVNVLVKTLIQSAADIDFNADLLSPQQGRFLQVLVDQIALLPEVALCLPFSNDPLLLPILSSLQAQPDSMKSLQEWSGELGASSKTLSRRFQSQLGMTFSEWRERFKLHRAIHWLNKECSVTQVAFDLGYESLAAFIQMFKRNMGVTPGQFKKS